MKKKEFIDLYIQISEKLSTLKHDGSSNLEAEVLHCSLALALKDLTEEDYKNLPIYSRKTIEKLETQLLNLVSFEYKKDYEKDVQANGKFRNAVSSQRRKCKQRIGFYLEEENTNKVD